MPLLRVRYWTAIWLGVRRSASDSRGRKIIATLLFAFLMGSAGMWFAAWTVTPNPWVISPVVLFLFALLVRRYLSILERDYVFSPTVLPTGSEADEAAQESVGKYLAERAAILAALLGRGLIEAQTSRDPTANVGEGRQAQNQALRKSGAWDQLDPSELRILADAEGTWALDDIFQMVTWCEHLRLLRFTLKVDGDIDPLDHFPRLDPRLIHLPNDLLGRGMLAPSDLRVQRDAADGYLARLLSESVTRRVLQGPDIERWAAAVRDQLARSPTSRWVKAAEMGSLADDELRLLCMMANARMQYATYLVEVLSSDAPFPFKDEIAVDHTS